MFYLPLKTRIIVLVLLFSTGWMLLLVFVAMFWPLNLQIIFPSWLADKQVGLWCFQFLQQSETFWGSLGGFLQRK